MTDAWRLRDVFLQASLGVISLILQRGGSTEYINALTALGNAALDCTHPGSSGRKATRASRKRTAAGFHHGARRTSLAVHVRRNSPAEEREELTECYFLRPVFCPMAFPFSLSHAPRPRGTSGGRDH